MELQSSLSGLTVYRCIYTH